MALQFRQEAECMGVLYEDLNLAGLSLTWWRRSNQSHGGGDPISNHQWVPQELAYTVTQPLVMRCKQPVSLVIRIAPVLGDPAAPSQQADTRLEGSYTDRHGGCDPTMCCTALQSLAESDQYFTWRDIALGAYTLYPAW